MLKKKLLCMIALLSIATVGASVGVITAQDKLDEALVAEKNEYKVTWNKSENGLFKGDTKIVDCKFEGGVFETTTPIQMIKSIQLNAGFFSQAKLSYGYYADETKEIIKFLPEKTIGNTKVFNLEPGKECSFIKIINANSLNTLEITYLCDSDIEEYNYYPVEKGLYVVGEGSFLNKANPVKWHELGGTKMSEVDGTYTATMSFKVNDEIRFYNPFAKDGWYVVNNLDANSDLYSITGYGQNIHFNIPCNVSLTLKDGNLTIARVGNTKIKFSLNNIGTGSNTLAGKVYLVGNMNAWTLAAHPMTSSFIGYTIDTPFELDTDFVEFKIVIDAYFPEGTEFTNAQGNGFKFNIYGGEMSVDINLDFSTVKANQKNTADVSISNL